MTGMDVIHPVATMGGCGSCACKSCLLYRSSRCPFGECWDDHRAVANPYNGCHDKVRTAWTNWDKPGEQEHWCRGGVCYEREAECPHFIAYDEGGHIVRTCLLANVEVFQDGYIRCSIIDNIGCEECYRRFEEKEDRGE